MCQRFFSPISSQVVDPKFRPVYHFGASELDQYVGSNLEMSKCQFYQQYAVVTALIPIETKLSKNAIIWVEIVAAMNNICNSVGTLHMVFLQLKRHHKNLGSAHESLIRSAIMAFWVICFNGSFNGYFTHFTGIFRIFSLNITSELLKPKLCPHLSNLWKQMQNTFCWHSQCLWWITVDITFFMYVFITIQICGVSLIKHITLE